MKSALILLGVLAVVLAIFAYAAVFGTPSGTYDVNPQSNVSGIFNSSSPFTISSSSATATLLSNTSSTASSTGASQTFASSFTTPYPISWTEGQSNISISGASLSGNELTLLFSIQMGSAPECVPLNLRLVMDEEGDLEPPTPPSFTFPESGNCNGAPSENYTNQSTTFLINPAAFPLLFTTNSAAGTFFEISTTTPNGIQIQLPGTSG